MKKGFKVLFTLVLSVLLGTLMFACKPEGESGIKPDVESVELVFDKSSVTPGTYPITTRCLPEDSDQSVNITLTSGLTGIAVVEDDGAYKLVVSVGAEDGTKFKLTARSTYDSSKFASKELVVSNSDPNAGYTMIEDEEDLFAIFDDADHLSKAYKLANDIELTQEWPQIGEADVELDDGSTVPGKPFIGVFDGNGYEIKGFLNKPAVGGSLFNGGFFAQIGTAGIVRNLKITGNVEGNGWCGGIAGLNFGTISNCISNVEVYAYGTIAGSLVSVNKSGAKIEYSIGLAKVFAEASEERNDRTQGLVGANEGEMIECYGDKDTMQTANYAAFTPTPNTERMLTTSKMKTASTFSEFDEDIWYIVDNSYPMLKYPNFVPPVVLDKTLTITNTEEKLDLEVANSLQLTSNVLNGSGSEVVVYELDNATDGVSISSTGLISFDLEQIPSREFSISVTATVEADSLTAKKSFNVEYNPVPTLDTIVITTERELVWLLSGQQKPEILAKNFELGNDIEMTSLWVPAGLASTEERPVGVQFTGVFDGKGYTISNFRAVMGYDFGFFGEIGDTGVVKNLGLVGNLYVGAGSGTIAAVNKGTISNIFLNASITCTANWVGGIVAHNYGTMTNIVSIGAVKKNDSNQPGPAIAITDQSTDGITNLYIDSETVGATETFNGSTALNSMLYTTAAMKTAATYTLSDTIWYVADGSYPLLKYPDFEAPVVVSVLITNDITSLDLETLTDNEYQLTHQVYNGEGDETVTFSLEETVAGVSITTAGKLSFNLETVVHNSSIKVIVSIDGTDPLIESSKTITLVYNPTPDDGKIRIGTESELLALCGTDTEKLAGSYLLTDNIVLSGWYSTPIGAAATYNEDETVKEAAIPFTGTFDGNGYTISGLKGGADGAANFGFFGEIGEGAVVKNLTLVGVEDADSPAYMKQLYVGNMSAIVASVNRGTIQNVLVRVNIMGTGPNVAGLVGINHGTIDSSLFIGTVKPSEAGESNGAAIAIYNHGTITNCYADNGIVLSGIAVAKLPADDTLNAMLYTTEQMKTAATYNLDSDYWNVADGSYPSLKVPE